MNFRPVANQLKLGEVFKPETYEEASIFFSDIVGFTAISSSSSPMQVILVYVDCKRFLRHVAIFKLNIFIFFLSIRVLFDRAREDLH